MKILYYANMRLGSSDGPSMHVVSVCRELSNLGHEVVLLTHKPLEPVENGNFRMIFSPASVLGYENWRTWRMSRALQWPLSQALAAVWRPDAIYERQSNDNSLSVELAQRWKIPRVVEINGWPHTESAVQQRAVQSAGAAALIVTAPGLKRIVAKTYDFDSDRIFFVANGADTNLFRPGLATADDIFRIGYVGYSHSEHDIRTVFEATKLATNRGIPIELRLIGDSSNREDWFELRRQLELDDYVEFLGRVPHSLLPEEMWKLDVCLAIYTSDSVQRTNSIEAALKLWEYWAVRKPVIVTDVPDSQSYHHHLARRYLAVPPEDPHALADALACLYTDREFAQTLAANGHKYAVEKHSWTAVTKQIEKILLKSVQE